MKKALFLILLILSVGIVGCKQEANSINYEVLSITEQIAALEMQRDLFMNLETTYDAYAKIHDYLYPEMKQLKDEVVLSVGKLGEIGITGEELMGLNLKKEKAYISEKDSGYVQFREENSLIQKVDVSISDVYKDKTLDWYYVFLLKKIALTNGDETYIPSRYTLEKVEGNYKVIEYSSDMRLGVADEKTKDDFLKKSGCSTFYGEPVTYIKEITY